MLKVDKPDRAPAAEAALDLAGKRLALMDRDALQLLKQWPDMQKAYAGDEYVVKIRDKEIRTALTTKSLSGTTIRKVSLPQYEDHGEMLKWLMLDNVPGSYPYTAGTFAFKREGEDPTRMFAGEGDAFRTNKRFKLLSSGMPAKRLSTAFDSVTLYGNDPDLRPDIYGKVGNSGVSIATLDDMKVLYSGFDLCSPTTSVSMTINGPAPTILAMFMNTAIDQQIEKFEADNGRQPTDDEIAKIRAQRIRALPGSFETTGAVLGAMTGIVVYDRPDDYVQTLKPRIEAQTDAQVQAAAVEIVKPEALTWVIVGDLKKIEKGVRALNLGEVKVLDAEGKVVR
jgi:methylmalonyl-CoA mutase